MSESEFLNHQPPLSVPRRRGLFLAAFNNFPYLMALPAIAAVLGLRLPVQYTLSLSAAAVALVWLFWKAHVLNLDEEASSHAHHRHWNLLSRLLKPAAVVLSRISVPFYTLFFWLVVTAINAAVILNNSDPAVLYIVWLLYIPVLMWPSYGMAEKASDLWLAVLFASAAAVVLAALYQNAFTLTWAFAGSLASHLTWFFFLSAFIHYLFRRLTIFRSQSNFLQQLIEQLRIERGYSEAFDARPITSGPDEHLNRIAREIGEKLKFERVFIHILDPEKGELFMKGCFRSDASSWPSAGWPIHGHPPSITGWVAQHKQAHLCGDTRKCDLYFNQNDGSICLSEAAVPIIAEDTVVGLIDIESSLRNAFDNSDVQLLWQIANSIGAALAYERHVSREVQKAYRLIEDSALKMVHSRSLDEALEQIADHARTLFGADLVTIYKHAVSTRVPLPGLIYRGEAKFPELLGNKIPSNSRVNELLRNKEEIYIQPFADDDDLLLGPNRGVCSEADARELGHPLRFVRREEIKSTVYIKLGLGQEVVGSLFLNYRQRTYFQKNQISALLAFGKTLAMALILKRQVERANGPLAGAIPLAHGQAAAAFESVRRKFYEIPLEQIADCPKCEGVRVQLQDFSARLELLERQWNNLILVEQRELHGSSLAEPIAYLESKLKSMFPAVQLKWNVQEFLHSPTDEFGEMVYKVIAEAVSNALVWGKAGIITVRLDRRESQILLTITNNGIPINPGRAEEMNRALTHVSTQSSVERNPVQREVGYHEEKFDKATGIFQILKDARRWFGATSSFLSDDYNGTLLSVTFPLGQEFIQPEEESDDDENGR